MATRCDSIEREEEDGEEVVLRSFDRVGDDRVTTGT
jgi:predicted deacetylase